LHLLVVSIFAREFWLLNITLPLGGVSTTPLELFGMVTALACVYLTVRGNIWCWPVGIVSAVAYCALFLHLRLLADTYLQVFFVGTSGLGWYWWLRGGPDHNRLPVAMLHGSQRILWALATVIAVATVGYFHANYTQARLPYHDALASGGSVTAQLLMMRKKVECWPLWILVNVVSIYIYIATHIVLTAILYGMLLALAALGWHQWTQEFRSRRAQTNAA
jgi:nicotinamide mononucleotide transporter